MRLLVIQPAFPHYRRPFFARLRQHVDALTLVHGAGRLAGERGAPTTDLDGVTAVPVAHRAIGPVIWMPALWQYAGDRHHDVVVFSWNTRYPNLPIAMLRARQAGMGVALWGHGYSIGRERTGRRAYRNLLARWADAVILYNHRVARTLECAGVSPDRIAVARNTLDLARIEAAAHRVGRRRGDLGAIRERLALGEGPVALHVSRLGQMHRLRPLLDVWGRVVSAMPEARLVVVGDGPARENFLAEIMRRGLGASIVCAGPVYDEEAIAPFFLLAHLLLHPVKVGLVLNHAMAYGLPVVTFGDPQQHSPEFEALRHGVNGVTAPVGDVAGLAALTTQLLRDEAMARRLGAAAHGTMRDAYTLDGMVEGFLAGVRRAAGSAARRTAPSRETQHGAWQH